MCVFFMTSNISNGHSDPTCEFLHPHTTKPLSHLSISRSAVCLATKYSSKATKTRLIIPSTVHQWGEVRRTDGCDTMVASLLGKHSVDRCDATHVCVHTLQALTSPINWKRLFSMKLS